MAFSQTELRQQHGGLVLHDQTAGQPRGSRRLQRAQRTHSPPRGAERRIRSVTADVKGEEACTRKGVYSENQWRMFIFIALGPGCDCGVAACFTCKWLPALTLTPFTHLFVGIWVCCFWALSVWGLGLFFWGLVWVWLFYFICISPWKESLLFLWIEILPFWCFSACFMLFLRNLVSKKGISLWLFLNISAWPIQQALDYYVAF